jgi:hypothetical protein
MAAEGFWTFAAVPGLGIRRVYVDPREVSASEMQDVGRAAGDEIERGRRRIAELCERGMDDDDYSRPAPAPERRPPPSDDPGESFLNRGGRKRGV